MSTALERWFDNKRLSPFRDFSDVQESFDRLFNEFMNLKKTSGISDFSFSPSCEIAEEGNNYVMKFDLPGVTKDQVKVEAENDQITIRAERKEEKKTDSKKKYLSELYYGSYVRSFTLPGPVDEKKVDAKFENGVLTVTIPKTEALKAKQIPIH
ncbi:MAG: molecular chaperone [Oligoflexia bacterium]|nr:MAG: molecular chaperone [Oligoflexia bacterium]